MIRVKNFLAVTALTIAISMGACNKQAILEDQQTIATAAEQNSPTKTYFENVDSNYTALHIVCGGEVITFSGTFKISAAFIETKNNILANETYISNLTGVSESGKVYTAKNVYKAHSVLNKNISHTEWIVQGTYKDAQGNTSGLLMYHIQGVTQSDGSIKLNINITNTCL